MGLPREKKLSLLKRWGVTEYAANIVARRSTFVKWTWRTHEKEISQHRKRQNWRFSFSISDNSKKNNGQGAGRNSMQSHCGTCAVRLQSPDKLLSARQSHTRGDGFSLKSGCIVYHMILRAQNFDESGDFLMPPTRVEMCPSSAVGVAGRDPTGFLPSPEEAQAPKHRSVQLDTSRRRWPIDFRTITDDRLSSIFKG
jgi:hypothetical protein